MQQYKVTIIICFAIFFGLGGFVVAYLWVLGRKKRAKKERSRRRKDIRQAQADSVIQEQRQEAEDLGRNIERLDGENQRLKAKVGQLDQRVEHLEGQLRVKMKELKDTKERVGKENKDDEKQKGDNKPKAQHAQPSESAGKR